MTCFQTPTRSRIAQALGLDARKLTRIARGEWTPQQHPELLAPHPELIEGRGGGLAARTITVPFGMYAENAYVFWRVGTRSAAVVDPGGATEQITGVLQEEDLSLDLVLITHAHGDHIGGLAGVLAQYSDATVVSSPVDRQAVMRGLSAKWSAAEDGAEIKLGEISIEPLATPGHTPGSTCFVTNGTCFVGDTLFAGSIGRPMSSPAYPAMLTAIRSKVLAAGGHAPAAGAWPITTAAEELEHNPFF